MFNRIPSDVSEIVVVYSRSYDSYLKLKEIVEKFKDERVETRIRDKLTEKYVYRTAIQYTLDDSPNREYNKPYYIHTKNKITYVENLTLFGRNPVQVNSDIPIYIFMTGKRVYKNRCIDVKGCAGYIYIIGQNFFYESGFRVIRYKRVNILEI